MKILLTLAITLSFICTSIANDLDSFTQSTDAFLKKYVTNGSVAYQKIKLNKSDIEKLYGSLGAISLESASSNTKKAFYINAYNLIVIYSIIQDYPLRSPMEVVGFFDEKAHLVAGETITLNRLEKDKLLSVYKDARIHFVLVCAAKSCPPLMSGAYTSKNVEEQLEQRTKITVNNNDWIRVDGQQKKVAISKIFEWYRADFISNSKSVLSWVNEFRSEKIPTSYKVSYYEYDWTLNE